MLFLVHWCDIHDEYGGCVKVTASNKFEAENAARKIVNIGADFHLVGVESCKEAV